MQPSRREQAAHDILLERLTHIDYVMLIFLAFCLVLGVGVYFGLNAVIQRRERRAEALREEEEERERTRYTKINLDGMFKEVKGDKRFGGSKR